MTVRQARAEPLPPPGEEPDIRRLVQDVLDGNPEAAECLVALLRPTVLKAARVYRSSMPGFERESLVDQCFANLIKGVRYGADGGVSKIKRDPALSHWKGDTEASLKAFVRKVVANLLHDWHRQNERRIRSYNQTEPLSELPDSRLPLRDGAAGSIQDELERTQLIQLLRESFAELPPQSREILLWRHYYRMTTSDIARRLDISSSRTETWLKKALGALRNKLLARLRRKAPQVFTEVLHIKQAVSPAVADPRVGGVSPPWLEFGSDSGREEMR